MRRQLKNRKSLKHQKAFFITICTHNRQNLFGEIEAGKMHLSETGKIIKYCWSELEKIHSSIVLGEFVIMPNHIHGLVFAKNPNLFAANLPLIQYSGEIGKIVNEFKNSSTKLLSSVVWSSEKLIWQKHYNEVFLQTSFEVERAREYILGNVFSWDLDPENINKEVVL